MPNYKKEQIKGATMIEYVLIVGLISIAAVLLLTNIGTNVSSLFTRVNTALTPAS